MFFLKKQLCTDSTSAFFTANYEVSYSNVLALDQFIAEEISHPKNICFTYFSRGPMWTISPLDRYTKRTTSP